MFGEDQKNLYITYCYGSPNTAKDQEVANIKLLWRNQRKKGRTHHNNAGPGRVDGNYQGSPSTLDLMMKIPFRLLLLGTRK